MFVVCDCLSTLNSSFFCRGSFIESILTYISRYGCNNSVVVFRDVYGLGKCENFQYITTLSSKNLIKIKDKYSHINR